MNGRMDKWIDEGWMDRRMDGRKDKRIDKYMDGGMNKQINNEWMKNGWTNG